MRTNGGLSLARALALFFVMLATSACSSKSSGIDAGGGPCDPAKCLQGNECLDDGTGTSCRLVCAAQADCPFNYYCTPSLTFADGGATINYCAADKIAYTPGAGTWGTSCQPTGGIAMNPACDFGQGFSCYAVSPTDGNAYCTQYGCTQDTDCAGGWYCATVNVQPNAETATRSVGQTNNVCQPRLYCASCTSDVDCDQTAGPEHCIVDKNGDFYCSPECASNGNCALDAQCLTLDESASCTGTGTCVCAARARECVGDGSLCSPCRSDADCPKGVCATADYSTERFCTVSSGVTCTLDKLTGVLTDDCPSSDEASVPVGCTTEPDANLTPPNECVGLVTFGKTESGGTEYVNGCYTPDR